MSHRRWQARLCCHVHCALKCVHSFKHRWLISVVTPRWWCHCSDLEDLLRMSCSSFLRSFLLWCFRLNWCYYFPHLLSYFCFFHESYCLKSCAFSYVEVKVSLFEFLSICSDGLSCGREAQKSLEFASSSLSDSFLQNLRISRNFQHFGLIEIVHRELKHTISARGARKHQEYLILS